ncbi:hypothetical protein BH23BAC1_BH23BAC1_42770 [soil metagenome]
MFFNFQFWKKKFRARVKAILFSGLSPLQLAKTVAVALMISLFPIYGVTTAILIFISGRFKMNLAVLIAISYSFTPIQLLLIPVFFNLGYWLFDPYQLELFQGSQLFDLGFITIMKTMVWGMIYAVSVWSLIALPVGFLLYSFLKRLFRTPIINNLWQNVKRKESVSLKERGFK